MVNNTRSNETLSSHLSKSLPSVSITYISENSVLLEWPEKVCAIQHQHIMLCQTQICNALTDKVIDCIASYASLLIYYKFELIPHDELNTLLHDLVQRPSSVNNVIHNMVNTAESAVDNNHEQNIIEVPVYYGNEAGWDLTDVAEQTQLSVKDIIKLHTQAPYRAYALGFTPGFCYLGELPAQLQLPRKASPRLSVPKGAVAIAEQQTAIYPNTSPGGWHIIGQTPLDMYSTDKQSFKSTINIGQSVKFVAISRAEFLSLGGTLIQEQH